MNSTLKKTLLQSIWNHMGPLMTSTVLHNSLKGLNGSQQKRLILDERKNPKTR